MVEMHQEEMSTCEVSPGQSVLVPDRTERICMDFSLFMLMPDAATLRLHYKKIWNSHR